jgi:hypothetical protein
MNRDNLKDAAYFEAYLRYQNARIEKFLSLANQTEKSKGLSDEGTQRAYGYVVGFVLDKLYASYSSGKTIDEIRQIFAELVDVSVKVNSLSYSHLIDLASFAVLLRPERTVMTKVAGLINNAHHVDILLEGFCNFLEGKGFVYTAKGFEFEEVYKPFPAIITQSDKNKQIELLAGYIKNDWYTLNEESAWYDSHKSKEDIYVGYWCFEGLALAVALGLETNKLKGLKYIPYDLINANSP